MLSGDYKTIPSMEPTMKHGFPKQVLALAITIGACSTAGAGHWNKNVYFERLATLPVYENLDLANGDDVGDTTAAEISTASADGNVLIYSDSPKGRIGLIDIRNPAKPKPAGFVQLDGEPTSVATAGRYLLVGVNTSADFVNANGQLDVFDMKNPLAPVKIASLPMNGQPDSVAISPDGQYAAVVIENERDEDINDALIPQLPAGFVNVVTLKGKPSDWQVRRVDLEGIAGYASDDPEPEYVSINEFNIAAVTLQENNHIVMISLRHAQVLHDFTAGSVTLTGVDYNEDDVINPSDTIAKRREPDAIAWVGPFMATANEGDYTDENGDEGGSRGFTLFGPLGNVWYDSGVSLERAIMRAGHYPESRSENKGVEPEGIAFSRFGKDNLLFVGSERANVVAVYDMKNPRHPALRQLLPAGIGPEGILPISSRNLLVVSSEEDSADDGFRSTVAIYRYGTPTNFYPQIESTEKALIPWGALSGLAADKDNSKRLYAVPDSYYKQSQIFKIDTSRTPATIDGRIALRKNDVGVNYDLEGIAQAADGNFWLASEGNGSSTSNLLIKASADGNIVAEYALPAAVNALQKSNGYEGVAVTGHGDSERVYVAFQREWTGDPAGLVRIGVFNPNDESWAFLYYPLDAAAAGTWNGLSEITAIGNDKFVVIERDNQQGPKAQHKRLYMFSIAELTPAPQGSSFPILAKTLTRDILPDLKATNGWVVDKVEGTALAKDGEFYVVTDNDGIEDATGETRFLRLGKLFR